MGQHPVSYDDLLDYLTDKLDAEKRSYIAQHVQTCFQCSETVDRMNKFWSHVRHNDFVSPSPATIARAQALFVSDRPAQFVPRFNLTLRSRGFAFAGGFGVAFIVIVGLALLIANQDIPQDSALYPVKVFVQGLEVRLSNPGQPPSVTTRPAASPVPTLSEPIAVPTPSPNIVISQIYGGGGNSGSTYMYDFIELFNRGATAASVEGWSVQYTSAAGTSNFGAGAAEITQLPNLSLMPGQYLLIQEDRGSGGTLALTAPDVIDPTPIQLSATGGKIVLVKTTVSLGCNGAKTPCFSNVLATIVDLVGYGKADFFEGLGPAPETANTTALIRLNGGCTDTNNNAEDFAVGYPNPRNSTPLNPCPATTPKPRTP